MAGLIRIRPMTAGLAFICAIAIFGILMDFNRRLSPLSRPLNPGSFSDTNNGNNQRMESSSNGFVPSGKEPNQSGTHDGGLLSKEWDILYHLGGDGPWIQKTEGVVTKDISPPKGCEVQQVHMLSRHGERYPTTNLGAKMLQVISKLNDTSSPLGGNLSFLNDWQFFVDDSQRQLDMLTTTGPYSGTLETFGTGVKFRTRYHHLIPKANTTQKLKVWASASDRVEATARYFSIGMFGLPLNDSVLLEVIPETSDRGADTLTPSDGCLRYRQDEIDGHDAGGVQLAQFQDAYLAPVLGRFQKSLSSATNLTTKDVYTMQEMCGFEMLVRGSSPWCNVFHKDEWESFEYARDLYHFYRSGPGNMYSKALGTPWLRATSKLLMEGPSAGPFFFSFTHDSDMVPTFGMLGLFQDSQPLPVDRVLETRQWKTSQVVPMGGRLVLESMSCEASPKSTDRSQFIRININDGIVEVPGCTSGPGSSCPLDQFLSYLQTRLLGAGDFKEICRLPGDSPDGISFLHQT